MTIKSNPQARAVSFGEHDGTPLIDDMGNAVASGYFLLVGDGRGFEYGFGDDGGFSHRDDDDDGDGNG